jgi:hypothetical protein
VPRSLAPSLLLGAALTAPAWAHHGFGNFDTNQEVTLKGTVTKIDFVNPHAYVYFSVVGANGAKTPYRCEMRAATVLRRSGWSAEMFKAGDPITITGAPFRRVFVLREHDRVRRWHDGGPLCAALEARPIDGAGRERAARAPAERRAEHLGRLGSGAGCDDRPAR